jgi:hypothetical protein
VRYTAKTGEFRSGGFILSNPVDVKAGSAEATKRYFRLQNGFNRTSRDHLIWTVAYENIEYLYAKASGIELALQLDLKTVATTLDAKIRRLADYTRKLEQRIGELEGKR